MDDVADAVLDGASFDWTSAEKNGDAAERAVLEQLKVLAAVVKTHREAQSEDPAASITGPKQWGHLRLIEPIGGGAFGEVYRAWDTKLDREVALKLVPVEAHESSRGSSMIEEGRLLARVRHPNVVTIYGADLIDRRLGLWMELVEGRTLQQMLDAGHRFSATEVVQIGLELCDALAAVHGAGLLHRDIKAHNIMLTNAGRLVLMDFGAGQDLSGEASASPAGTPLYLAPELLHGAGASTVSDLYSVGVLLYRLLTGSYPVQASGLRELRAAHERGARTDVRIARRDVPARLARVITRALDPQPERRYQSVEVLEADLLRMKPRPTLLRRAFALGAVAVLLLGVAIAWEAGGRQLRLSTTPLALLNRLAGFNPRDGTSVSALERPIIAVLPLQNLSAEPDSDYFTDGLTDEIIRSLAVIEGLQVRSRTSSFAFKDKPRNLRDVGEQLGANLVVEGSVLRDGNRLRVNAQLVQIDDDVPLWSERFDRELEDVFPIQDEISRAIVNRLRLTLGRGQRRYDTNIEAYELYLKARAILDRRDEGSNSGSRKAAELFQQVIEKDRAFAPAWAGLANASAVAAMSPYGGSPYGGPSFDAMQKTIREAAAEAIQLDPLLAEAHAAMGWLHAREFDWEEAHVAFRRAIDLNPALTHVYANYSFAVLRPIGNHVEAERLLRVALTNDPLSLDVRRELAQVLLFMRRYGEAMNEFERIRATDPDFPVAHFGRTLTLTGRVREAIAELEGPPGFAGWLAHAYVRAGRRSDAEKLAAVHRDYPFRQALIYAALGDKDRTFEALERMAESEPQRLPHLLTSPELALLEGDVRLAPLRRRLRLPDSR